MFKAPIDTTFAVYKPYFKGEFIDIQQLYLRTGFPYSVRHLPWYVDNNNLTEEELTGLNKTERKKKHSCNAFFLYNYQYLIKVLQKG